MNEERIFKKLDSIDSKIDGFVDTQHKRDIEIERRITKAENKIVTIAAIISVVGTAIMNTLFKKL